MRHHQFPIHALQVHTVGLKVQWPSPDPNCSGDTHVQLLQTTDTNSARYGKLPRHIGRLRYVKGLQCCGECLYEMRQRTCTAHMRFQVPGLAMLTQNGPCNTCAAGTVAVREQHAVLERHRT
jgi:hypothetical protein